MELWIGISISKVIEFHQTKSSSFFFYSGISPQYSQRYFIRHRTFFLRERGHYIEFSWMKYPRNGVFYWQRKGNGKFLESSIICFSLGNQICHLHCKGTGLITYNEDIDDIYADNHWQQFYIEFEIESLREKNTRITTVFNSKYLLIPSIVRMFDFRGILKMRYKRGRNEDFNFKSDLYRL